MQGLQPVAFASHKLNSTETRYSVYERELLGIVWEHGQWRHYFQVPRVVVVRSGHSSLWHLLNQNAVNTRIWKWLEIMQGYNLVIQYILGKINPADHLSYQSLNQSIERKKMVRTENDKFFQHMRIPGDASDAQIQQSISDIVYRNQFFPRPDSRPS